MQDSQYPWLSMESHGTEQVIGCDRCGSRTTLKLPIPVEVFSISLGDWVKLHSKCREQEIDKRRAEAKTAKMPKEPGARVAQWMIGDDRGISSEYLAAVFMGAPTRRGDYPLDPSDFGRCYRLLKLVPEIRKAIFAKVARRDSVWRQLILHWDEIEKLYLEELPSGMAPKCYALMRKLIDLGRAADMK